MVAKLQDLLSTESVFGSVLVYGKSSKYLSLVTNLAKKKFQVDSDSVVRLNDINEITKLGEEVYMRPFRSFFRLIIVDNQTTEVSEKVVNILNQVQNHTRLVLGFQNYRVFQSFRYKAWLTAYQPEFMFSTYLTGEEFDYLYRATLKAQGSVALSDSILKIVNKRYLRDPEAIFTILSNVKDGIEITDNMTLVKLVGVGSLQIEKIALGLVSSTTKTGSGLKQYQKKYAQQLVELGTHRSLEGVRKSLLDSLKAILILKELLVEGKIYPEVGVIPDLSAYNNFHINKYVRSLERIDLLSMVEIVNFMSLVESSRWSSDLDVLSFTVRSSELIKSKNRGVKI